MKFTEHGHFQMKSDGDILYYQLTDTWNKEASITCIEALRPFFIDHEKQANDNAVIMLVDTLKFEGGLLDAFEYWFAASKFWYANGLTHFIRIDNPDSVHYEAFIKPLDALVKQKIAFSFADNLKDAIAQAKTLGFIGFENDIT